MKKIKSLPRFKSVEEESDYWDKKSTTDFDSEDITEEFLNELRNSSGHKKKITIRLDEDLIHNLKKAAKKHGVPYQRFTRELLRVGIRKIS